MALCSVALLLSGCHAGSDSEKSKPTGDGVDLVTIDQFADVRIMRYEIPGWDSLAPKQRVLLYYLSQAALCGRDILYDQNCQYNLSIRRILEAIYGNYAGEKNGENWDNFMVYLKRVWFSNGIHHNRAETKIIPEFPVSYFRELVKNTPFDKFPSRFTDTTALFDFAIPVLYDPALAYKRVNKTGGEDVVMTSATNFYRGVTQAEVEAFQASLLEQHKDEKLPYGMNSQLVKIDGKIQERVWKLGGMYSPAIEQIIGWLRKAETVAETPEQETSIRLLIQFYETGKLQDFNDYSIAWVKDTAAQVDFINGFIEDYGDPMGIKCSWESLVNFKDLDATHRMETLSQHAQWFEDNSPVDARYKKAKVRGITAKVINAVMLGGDCYPATPIGINLPNANWIRAEHGSKSVTIENITAAYDKAAQGNGFLEEFAYSQEEVERARKYGSLSSNVHTDLHECLGHASGRLAPGVKGDELKNYSATLEEARADLFALYYIMDPKMVEIGILPNLEYGKAEYDGYIRNGMLTQLTRIKPGEQIEEAHMRNRALIARWAYEKGLGKKVIERKEREEKQFVVINDYDALRDLFGQLLREVQRIKSEGDFAAGKALVEKYGVHVDEQIHRGILARYEALNLAPNGGFINPIIEPIMDGDKVIDAKVTYPTDYVKQMLDYSNNYSFLPDEN